MNNNIDTQNCGCTIPGCIKKIIPNCHKQLAVIPAVTVDNKTGLKGLAECFAHVADINTTFYIDDKHRIMIVWAGPVEVENYAYTTNPLGLRSQMCYDFSNNRAIYYNRIGEYKVITLS